MINKIIFRAKLKSTMLAGSWVYWNVYGELCAGNGKRHPLKLEMPHSVHLYYNIIQIQNIIDSNTIGRYVELADKNGTKIFEGDILEAHFDEFFPDSATRVSVAWHGAGFVIKQNETLWDALLPEDREEWEVIGNIHDNPELLEVGE